MNHQRTSHGVAVFLFFLTLLPWGVLVFGQNGALGQNGAFWQNGIVAPPGQVFPGLLGPEEKESGSKASAQVLLERSTVAAGGEMRVAIVINIRKGWHLYHDDKGPADAVGMETTVAVKADGVSFSKVKFPKPERIEQPALGEGGRDTWINGHHGRITLYVLGKVEKDAAGERELEVKINGLTCEEMGSCVTYKETLAARFQIGLEASPPQHADVFKGFPPAQDFIGQERGPEPAPGDGKQAAPAPPPELPDYEVREPGGQHSLIVYILLGVLAGFILNFMPCVLPVISIKILSFVQQAGEDPKRVFRLGLTFAAGILSVFVVLASLAAFASQGWGEQFQSQTFLVVMIAIVFGFSLSLFGVYEIGVPQSVAQAAGSATLREGHGDAFFKGVMATLLATPCSGPFLGSTLTWALSEPPAVIYTIFLAIGSGMALPYVLLTARPGWLKILPRSGPWMETFKHTMGFILLLTVIYLMVSLEQRLLLFTVAFLLFVALAAWLYGRYAGYQHSRPRRLAVEAVAAGMVALGAYLSFDVFPGFFQSTGERLSWVAFDPQELQRHHREGRSVLVDWTADWCPNCKFVEKFVLESDEARELFERKGVVTMKADITHENEKTAVMVQLRNKLGSRSIPFLAIFPGDSPYRPFVLRDIYTRSDLRGILESVRDPVARTP